MSMYKKAAKLKLRFITSRGSLGIEQLMDLSMTELERLVRAQHKVLKEAAKIDASEELDFLEVDKTPKDNIEQLKFDILKDIYMDKRNEKADRLADEEKRKRRERLAELIAEKKEEADKGKSLEELEKELAELDKK